MEDVVNVAQVIITNKDRSLFYMQQKDETYNPQEYRLHYTFFGGHMEQDESDKLALKRELSEELEKSVAELIFKRSKKIKDIPIKTKSGPKNFHIFEAVVSKEELDEISSKKIREGKKGSIIKFSEVEEALIISPVKEVLIKYLSTVN